jgi:glycosyltransferase involved in cell wall biosynthesis
MCGLATFAAALGGALEQAGHWVEVIRLQNGTDLAPMRPPVSGEIVNGDIRSLLLAADVLDRCDVVIVQHEYGIFGGEDGSEVLDLLDALTVPVIAVLHTVPLHPTEHQRSVLVDLCARSACAVVMSSMAAQRLVTEYPIARCRVAMVPHGAVAVGQGAGVDSALRRAAPSRGGDPSAPELLTWGLLGPGKGIEHVIDALGMLSDMTPQVRYTVAGVTHPNVLAQSGDVYRRGLVDRARALELSASVDFDDSYRDVATLTQFVASSTLVVLPYDSHDQVTSGVLVDAVAAGRPVIATEFPHAVEMLSSGAGIVVPHGDPRALAGAIRSVLGDGDRWGAMAAEARRISPRLSWGAVARSYVDQIDQIIADREPVLR